MRSLVYLFASTVIFFSLSSNASYYLEPGLFYNLNKTYERNKIPTGYEDALKGKLTGFDLALRGGCNIDPTWFAGLDLRYNMVTMVPKTGDSLSGSMTAYGLNAGANIGAVPGLKTWLGYYFGGSGKLKNSANEAKIDMVNAINLGVSYKVHDYVDIAFELGLAGHVIDSDDYTYVLKSGMNLGVSVPFEF